MSGDDQIMSAARRSCPARMGDQPRMAGCSGLGVVEHLDSRRDGDEGPRAISGSAGSVGKLDADPVLGNGDGRDGKLVRVQGSPVNSPALIGDSGY